MYGTGLLWWEYAIGALIVASLGAAVLVGIGRVVDRLVAVGRQRDVFFWAWLLPLAWVMLIVVMFAVAG